MKKRSNGVLVIIIIMMVLSLAGGTLGLLANMNKTTKPDDPKKEDYVISYKYYLDSEEVSKEFIDKVNVATNNCENSPDPNCVNQTRTIKFEKYACTNNVKGEWNDTKWEFTPNLTANTTCRLYFTNLIHSVKFTASNGVLPSKKPEEILQTKVGDDTTITILPNEGYKFDKVECNNNAKAEFNSETNVLTVKNVVKDTTCNISFKINDYTVEVKASNGNVTEDPISVNYGGSAKFNVTPAENYGDATVSCTNNQKATYSNNVLTVNGITNSTVCTVQFKPIKHSVSLTIENGSLLSQSANPQTTQDGGTVTFAVSPTEGYGYNGADISCDKEGTKIEIIGSNNIVMVYNVKSNLNCKVVLKKLAS